MNAPLVIFGALVLLHAVSLAEQAGAKYWAPKAALYFKVSEDDKGRVWVRYVGKSVRPAGRQSQHLAQARKDRQPWRSGELHVFRYCWTERQEARIERRRILALAAFYRHRSTFRSTAPQLENVVLNRKPRGLAETVTVYAALACYLAESVVYRPTRTWATPRRPPKLKVVFVTPAPPPPVPALPPAVVLGPGRHGPRHALPSGSWSVDVEGATTPLTVFPAPPPVPEPLTPCVSSPAVPLILRGAGDANPSMTASAADGPGPSELPPPPPVPVRAKRPKRPRPAPVAQP